MSVKFMIGQVTGQVTKTIKYTKDGKQESFDQTEFYIQNGGRPERLVSTTGVARKNGEDVKIPFFIKLYKRRDGGSGYEMKEARGDD
jgi:hypothetical protein